MIANIILFQAGNLPTICGNMLHRIVCSLLLLQIIANCGIGESALRQVSLVVEPPAVRRGQHATFRCIYDLGNAPLYSVKFYRGLREFYRYSPSENPRTKMFPFPGINVDLTLSNASQVIIRNVGFGLSGNFSCEVTADAPYFSTATAYVQMQVIELPEKRPYLWSDHDRYEPGDVLRANCSSPPSRPRADLKFTLNNMMVVASDPEYITTVENLIATRISLRLHLQSSHYVNGMTSGQMSNSINPATNGGLVLRCTAQISNVYQEYSEIELGVQQRDPIPARVTSSSASNLGGILLQLSATQIASLLFAINMNLITSAGYQWVHYSCR